MCRILAFMFALCFSYSCYSQTTFWSEDFGTGCSTGFAAQSYNGPNGSWSSSNTGFEGGVPNIWYVSAEENGNIEGACGSPCGSDRTLHMGSTFVGDLGAAYFDSGLSCGFPSLCGTTNKRAESPMIDCTGYSDITLDFLYLEGGNGTDNATLWINTGAGWSELSDPPKTALICSPQGIWTAYNIALPIEADDNANVQIGFRWINNDDGIATDPSFAVDDIMLTGMEASAPCPCDFNEDGIVSTADLLLLLSQFGFPGYTIYDLNMDGSISTADLLSFLICFGSSCP